MDSIVRLGQSIKAARAKKHLTQDDLSDKAGLAYSTLAKIEQGAIKNPSVFTVYALAQALGVQIEELMDDFDLARNRRDAEQQIAFLYCDVNGVLLRFYNHAFVSLAKELDVSVDRVETTFWHYNDPVNRGEITMKEFDEAMAKYLGVKQIDWKRHYMNAVEPVTEMYPVLKAAHKKTKIGLLTNISPGFIDELFEKGLLPDIKFDEIIDSSVIGAVKPEVEMYEAAEVQAGVKPEQIILIDDSRANLVVAQRRGWQALWFDDYNPSESVKRVKQILDI